MEEMFAYRLIVCLRAARQARCVDTRGVHGWGRRAHLARGTSMPSCCRTCCSRALSSSARLSAAVICSLSALPSCTESTEDARSCAGGGACAGGGTEGGDPAPASACLCSARRGSARSAAPPSASPAEPCPAAPHAAGAPCPPARRVLRATAGPAQSGLGDSVRVAQRARRRRARACTLDALHHLRVPRCRERLQLRDDPARVAHRGHVLLL